MSLNAIVDTYLDRRYGKEPPRQASEFTAGRPTSTLEIAGRELIKWIPVEILSFYVPAADLFSNVPVLWAIYGLALVMTPVYVFVRARKRSTRLRKPGVTFEVPAFPMIAATVAFAVWAAALPGSVFLQQRLAPTQAMTLAVLAATLILTAMERITNANK